MARATVKRARGGDAGWKWWHGALAGMLLMASPGLVALLLPLVAPALLVAVADTVPGRPLARTVALFSVAGAIGPLRAFVEAGHDLQAALTILMRPATILVVWLCAGFGWLLSEIFCVLAVWTARVRLAARKTALEARLQQIRTEWDLPEENEAE